MGSTDLQLILCNRRFRTFYKDRQKNAPPLPHLMSFTIIRF